jgi:hypothetical protein
MTEYVKQCPDGAAPSVLLAASKWWPLSARLALAFLREGCRVSVVCPAHHPLHFVAGLERIHRYAGGSSLASLQRAILVSDPWLVIPCDDGVVAQLHALHDACPALRPLIERSLGPAHSFPVVRSRFALLMLARDLGVPIPRTRAISSEADLVGWHREVSPEGILKADGETGGNGVQISRRLEESLSAWRQLRAPLGRLTARKRRFIDRDPLAVWQSRAREPRGLIIQELINGRPANSMIACRDGAVLAMISVLVVASSGPTGAAVVIRRIHNEPMRRAAEMIAGRLGLSGFFGLDYVIDSLTDTPYLVEMNPRCTQLGHLEFVDQPSLAATLLATWPGARAATSSGRGARETYAPALIRGEYVAFFPQALAAGGAVAGLVAASHHDVPKDAPALAAELGQRPWPQRTWQARCYHRYRPLAQSEPVVFEAPLEGASAAPFGITTRRALVNPA